MAGAYQDASFVYILLELKQGGDLNALCRHQKLGAEECRFYAANVCLALEYLHVRTICYRDLKPENVLIDSDGYACICDFGMAKVLGEGGRTMTRCGTPKYVAPELLGTSSYGLETDWWSFGVLLYELVTRKVWCPSDLRIHDRVDDPCRARCGYPLAMGSPTMVVLAASTC